MPGPEPTSRQYSHGPVTQRKASPSTATWQTDGNDKCVATSDSRLAASSRRRATRTRAASSLFVLEAVEPVGVLQPDLEHGVAGEGGAGILPAIR
jgi:hypothetical protein